MDKKYMKRVIELAKLGWGNTNPNPLVGAVVVKDGEIIAEGYHGYYGGEHAEVDALKKINFNAQGATLYVNLEPCCHYGKTPPCVDAIIKSKVSKVVIAMRDPNPKVSG
ncbi:MAG: bifunctional diaminohydroxyphosphoribosylaminopyrimidine deaminase/5-amino-6-(5-phosphoribosylamino)uracil reductase RibD, partial [Negativicutes bacterium]|nr:bifunctional diaminohydroxyphosphoribosylaminopyrimidine deaminase/5-amino-6-(5-phosphoribosylamino)uracil reductase RibD [Negativicutes bacterium]